MVAAKVNNQACLFVMGGKENVEDRYAISNVFKLNLEEYFKNKANKQTDHVIEWEEVAPMNEDRCMFSALVVDQKYIFVYGGTKESFDRHNEMPISVCERYDLQTSTWASFTIKNGPNISSFGWCPSIDKGCIYVLGGSDGLILTTALYKIDFNQG